jgi:hypothetical protein
MKSACYPFALLIAATLLVQGCSKGPEVPAPTVDQAADADVTEIERFRTALTAVMASQQALALETAKFNEANWSSVAERSLGEANALQSRIEGLMEFEEAAPAAATLRLHVAGLQRQLQGLDADRWQAVLPDLLLLNESIQSDMDELMDLAAPAPEDMPAHVHDLPEA